MAQHSGSHEAMRPPYKRAGGSMRLWHYMIVALAVFADIWQPSYGASPSVWLKAASHDPDNCMLALSGEISQRSVEEFIGIIATTHCGGDVWLTLDSPGGDVAAAMTLGRVLRKARAKTVVQGTCASACVLVYVGGVVRMASSLGLHRPFSVDSTVNYEESARQTEQLKQEILQYVTEMNVSPRLLDEMNVVPPNEIRWLTEKEVNELIGEEDPAYGDWSAGQAAARFGVPKEEYFHRRHLVDQLCSKLGNARAQGEEFSARELCTTCMLRSGNTTACPAQVARGREHGKRQETASVAKGKQEETLAPAIRVLLVCKFEKDARVYHFLADYDAKSVSNPDNGVVYSDVQITDSSIAFGNGFEVDRVTGTIIYGKDGEVWSSGRCEAATQRKF